MSQSSGQYYMPMDHLVQQKVPKQRSLPIPKEVNNFMIEHFGAAYYNCYDCTERLVILKNIESALAENGYKISWFEIERRLKNMKSHYRRKRIDLQQGIVPNTEWDYYAALDKIFSAQEEMQPLTPKVTQTPTKKRSESTPGTPLTEDDNSPQDLSFKRRRIIEFNTVSDIQEQLPAIPNSQPLTIVTPSQSNESGNQSREETIKKIVESIQAVDQQRLVLDQTRITLEIRRYEIDMIGYQLSNLLLKLTRQS